LSDLAAFEAALASLVPRADGIGRDRLMFLAGQAAVAGRPVHGSRSRNWAWPAAFSAMTAVAATLLAVLVTLPGSQVVERVVPVRPELNGAAPSQADRRPATPANQPPGQATAGNDAAGSEGLKLLPAWPFGSIVSRSDWAQRRLDGVELSAAGYALSPDGVRENGPGAAKKKTGTHAEDPTMASPPAAYRELLDKLLKESGGTRVERKS